jgi:hypothetical protein
MALTSAPLADDLVSILCELPERRHPQLGPWCRASDAQAVRRAIIDRTEDLRKLLDQAVRLLRIAGLASTKDYTEFLYREVPALRPSVFKAAIEKAGRQGRLQPFLIDVDREGVLLREPAMGLGNDGSVAAKGYELSYAQMPRPAVLIDVLHNALGYHVVAEAVARITVRAPAESAKRVSADLRSRLNAWLAPRLESAHRRQQAKLLQAFLASRNALSPDAIDDEVVFAFWQSRAEHWHAQDRRVKAGQLSAADYEKAARDEGFRVFRSAAKAVLQYREALADAVTASALEHVTESEIPVEVASSTSVDPVVWQNPIAKLMRPPADRVKWLTEKECNWLTNYLGRGATPRARNAGGMQTDGLEVEYLSEDEVGKAGLMEGRPFDLALLITLLRVDVLVPIQASAIAGLKRRLSGAAALESAISNADSASYLEAVLVYKRIRDQIEVEALAALEMLAKAAEPMALLLIEQFGGPAVTTLIRRLRENTPTQVVPLVRRHQQQDESQDLSRAAEEELAQMGLTIRRIFDGNLQIDGPLHTLTSRAAAARKRVSRAGFKADEAQTPEVLRSLALAVPAVVDLLALLDRLLERVERAQPNRGFAEDRQRFIKVLQLIYATEPLPEAGSC